MRRKVVKHGPSSLVVSLPSSWVRKNRIKKGDELDVSEDVAGLRIATELPSENKSVDIDVSGLDRSSIMYYLRTMYKLGYDEVRITFSNQLVPHLRLQEKRTVISVIHEELARLIGIEVIEQRQNRCVVRVVGEMPEENFRILLRRSFLLLKDMFSDFETGYARGDSPLLQTLEEKHNSITKLLSYCVRFLKTKGQGGPKLTLAAHAIIVFADKICDCLKECGRIVLAEMHRPGGRMQKNIQLAKSTIESYMDLGGKFSAEAFARIAQQRNLLIKASGQYRLYRSQEQAIMFQMVQVAEYIYTMSEHRLAMDY